MELDPKHIEANHNYCVALVEERNLKEAEKCLLNVYKLAPHLDYVQGKNCDTPCVMIYDLHLNFSLFSLEFSSISAIFFVNNKLWFIIE